MTNITSSTFSWTALSYQYDALNRLTNALANGNAAASYSFDTVGNLQTLHYSNGSTPTYQYDTLNRLTNLLWQTSGNTVASFAYQLSPTGNRTNAVEFINSVTPIRRTNQWQYDSIYRMTNETIVGTTSGTLAYGFDVVGNRLSRSSAFSLPNQTLTYGSNDWLTTDGYDNNGNTTNSASTVYQYDVENRLTNANGVSFVYNGDGQRVSKTAGGVTTLYLVDTLTPTGYPQVLEELIGTNVMRGYTYGLSLVSQRLIGSSTNYYGMDGHGSVRCLLSTNGVITDTYSYDAYGLVIATTGTTPNRYQYCAEQYDSDLGMYYLRARYYQPGTGRFWTRDSYEGDQEDPLSLHKYLYGGDNPVDNSDPEGTDFEMDFDLGSSLDSFSFGGIGAQVERLANTVAGQGHISSKKFWNAYKQVNYDTFPPEKNVEVWKTVGGNIGKKFGPVAENSCATRVSWGLNYGGFPIPKGTVGAWHNFPDQSYEGKKGDDKFYIINAGNMNAFLKSKWGAPDFPQVADVPSLNSIITGLAKGQCAIFATRQSPGHSGALKKGYQDPYVDGELPLDVWKLGVP